MKTFFNKRIYVKVGDITKEEVDAIVNAANSSLMGGGGVDGAIHRAGGPNILLECKEIRKNRYANGLPTGQAVITTGGALKANYVIHTVGPIYGREGGAEDDLLASCYLNSLSLALDNELKSIAFPAISTGVYGFPRDRAAQIIGKQLKDYIVTKSQPEKIELVFFSKKDAEIFLNNCGW